MTEDSSIVEDAGSKDFGNLGIAKIVLTPTPHFGRLIDLTIIFWDDLSLFGDKRKLFRVTTS